MALTEGGGDGKGARPMKFKQWQVAPPCPEGQRALEAGGLSPLLAAVLSLPEKYRLPVHLFYYEGYSIAETAAVLGRRESTVRAQLTRARAMLREKLEVECI